MVVPASVAYNVMEGIGANKEETMEHAQGSCKCKDGSGEEGKYQEVDFGAEG